jgi:hypothetical protein
MRARCAKTERKLFAKRLVPHSRIREGAALAEIKDALCDALVTSPVVRLK